MSETVQPGRPADDTLDEPFEVTFPSRRHAQLLSQLLAAELHDFDTSGTGRHRHDTDVDDVASELSEIRDTLLDQLAG